MQCTRIDLVHMLKMDRLGTWLLGYQPVPTGTQFLSNPPKADSCLYRLRSRLLPAFALLVLGIVVGLLSAHLIGSITTVTCPDMTLVQPPTDSIPAPDIRLKPIKMPFQYNRTFGQNPFRNNATVEAWEAILPRKFPSHCPRTRNPLLVSCASS
jgi:hypothetical protein